MHQRHGSRELGKAYHACPEHRRGTIEHGCTIVKTGQQSGNCNIIFGLGRVEPLVATLQRYKSLVGRNWEFMGPEKNQIEPIMMEVSHQVNSPLAAIRNALYLAAQRTKDAQIIEYLQIADDEVSSIVKRIKELRAEVECQAVAGRSLKRAA